MQIYNFFKNVPETHLYGGIILICVFFVLLLILSIFYIQQSVTEEEDTLNALNDNLLEKYKYNSSGYLYVYPDGMRIMRSGAFVSKLISGVKDIKLIHDGEGPVLFVADRNTCYYIHCGMISDQEYQALREHMLKAGV